MEENKILGLIGPNGAGKTTALNAILGLTGYDGELRVLGRNTCSERDQLHVATYGASPMLPSAEVGKVSQLLEYNGGVHPRFDRAGAEGFLAKTDIQAFKQGQAIVEGHGDRITPRPGHGH